MEGGHRIDSMFLGRRPVGVLWNLTNEFQMIIKNIEEKNVINKEEGRGGERKEHFNNRETMLYSFSIN